MSIVCLFHALTLRRETFRHSPTKLSEQQICPWNWKIFIPGLLFPVHARIQEYPLQIVSMVLQKMGNIKFADLHSVGMILVNLWQPFNCRLSARWQKRQTR